MYTDPTGHYVADTHDGECDLDCVWDGWVLSDHGSGIWVGHGNEDDYAQKKQEIWALQDDVPLIWKIAPTTIAVDYGVASQQGLVLEDIQFQEGQVAYNFYSGQLGHIGVTSEPSGGPLHKFGHLGTPGIVGASGYFGLTLYWGATDLTHLEGRALSGGKDASVDGFLTFGVNKETGYGLREGSNIMPFIDPYSRVPIRFSQWNITSGANLAANGADFGVFGGYSETTLLDVKKLR